MGGEAGLGMRRCVCTCTVHGMQMWRGLPNTDMRLPPAFISFPFIGFPLTYLSPSSTCFNIKHVGAETQLPSAVTNSEAPSSVPRTMPGGSRPPVTPAPGNRMPSFGWLQDIHGKHTERCKNKTFFFKSDAWSGGGMPLIPGEISTSSRPA